MKICLINSLILFFIISDHIFAQSIAYFEIPEIGIRTEPVSGVSYHPYLQSSSAFYDQITDSLIIPIKKAGNLILIETEIDGIKGNLIFDTGSASLLVLNNTYFRNKKRSGTKTSKGITGNVGNVEMIKIDSLLISEKEFLNLYADVTDLSHIENKKGVKILGFFGLELVKDFELIIDVKSEELKIIRNSTRKTDKSNHIDKYDYRQDIEIENNILFLWASVAGKDLKFCFDTGAEKNVLSLSLPQKVINECTFTGRINLSGAGSPKKDVLCGVVKNFTLGTKKIDYIPAIFTDLSGLSEVYGVQISGILGYDFLTIGKISINCEKMFLGINFN